jgi:hypothetical protein
LYGRLGEEIRQASQALSPVTNVSIDAYWSLGTWKLDDVNVARLYGLFHPFTSSQKLRAYPFGETDEAALLETYASYCARYRHVEGGLQPDDLVVEGIHIAQSILFGIRGRANYLATVPLPALDGSQLEEKVAPARSVSESLPDSPEWWPNQILLKTFGLDLESLRSRFVHEIAGAGKCSELPA